MQFIGLLNIHRIMMKMIFETGGSCQIKVDNEIIYIYIGEILFIIFLKLFLRHIFLIYRRKGACKFG